jgi:uncharacterized NAD-dependent epimerase/dehydratase family protein
MRHVSQSIPKEMKMIPSPYFLYLGEAKDEIAIKTSRGLAVFRPDDCVGEMRGHNSDLTLGLPALSLDQARAKGAKTLVLGVANAGGVMSPRMVADAIEAVRLGLNIASGLHQRLRDVPELVAAARVANVTLFDVRDPPLDLPIGNGAQRAGLRCLTVGTDCSVGKMYTSLCLEKAMRARSIKADFRATGQTGILIAGGGVPVDAVVADFISGAIEYISPPRSDGGWDIIEGQGSLFHPSFAGVSLGLLHGAQPDVLIMCHDPSREHMRGLPHYAPPDLGACIETNLAAARLTNSKVQMAGIALNTSKLNREDAETLCEKLSQAHGLPCVDPFAMSCDPIIDRMLACV